MKRLFCFLFTVAMAVFVGIGCENLPTTALSDDNVVDADVQYSRLSASSWSSAPFTAPAEIVTVSAFDQTATFWPYTGENFEGNGQDPINIVLFGEVDPRQIRAALFSLDGDRTAYGLPDVAPFNATWSDAIGDVQAGYDAIEGWSGGVVQLACGGYGPARFHIRLFKMGDYTIANAHFEILIPGTTNHQVLSWELAEQFLLVDFIRSGLLGAAPETTELINEPNYRTIPAMIYNLLPVDLRYAIGGPLDNVSTDVPIGGDGHASAIYLAGAVPVTPGITTQDFIVNFDQTIPKPFCAESEYDYLYVTGDVHLYQTVEITEDGNYRMDFEAKGTLFTTPVNPLTGEITGETLEAVVNENHAAYLRDDAQSATARLFQRLLPASDPNNGWYFKRIQVDSKGRLRYEEEARCPEPVA